MALTCLRHVTSAPASCLLVTALAWLCGVLRVDFAWPGVVVPFFLEGKHGQQEVNPRHEAYEQIALSVYLRPGDVVLNVGADIGTSCIFAQKKLLVLGGERPAHPDVICVEPNNPVIPLMRRNFKNTGTEQIHILNGAISDGEHCPSSVRVFSSQGDDGNSVNGSAGSDSMFRFYGEEARLAACFTIGYIRALLKGRLPSVVFADCEGCLRTLFQQQHFKEMLSDADVRLVIYEDDRNHTEIERGLQSIGFFLDQAGWVKVWQKGPKPWLTLQCWALLGWGAMAFASTAGGLGTLVPWAAFLLWRLDRTAFLWTPVYGRLVGFVYNPKYFPIGTLGLAEGLTVPFFIVWISALLAKRLGLLWNETVRQERRRGILFLAFHVTICICAPAAILRE